MYNGLVFLQYYIGRGEVDVGGIILCVSDLQKIVGVFFDKIFQFLVYLEVIILMV